MEHAGGKLNECAIDGNRYHELVAGLQRPWGDDREAVCAEVGQMRVEFCAGGELVAVADAHENQLCDGSARMGSVSIDPSNRPDFEFPEPGVGAFG